jgi:hypothetical protein
MWVFLRNLPEVLWISNILPMLGFADIIRTEKALIADIEREEFLALVGAVAGVPLPNNVRDRQDIWSWFWKRGIAICKIWLSLNESTDQLAEIADNIGHLPEGMHVAVPYSPLGTASTYEKGIKYLTQSTVLRDKVTSLNAFGILDGTSLAELCLVVSNLQYLDCGTDTNCQSLISMIKRNTNLTSIDCTWKITAGDPIIEAVAERGETLKSLHLHGEMFPVHVQHLGAQCTRLTSLSLDFESDLSLLPDAVAAIMTLAQNCCQLEHVRITKSPWTGAALPFAEHCQNLRSLCIAPYMDLSKAVLAALDANCPSIESLHIVRLAVTAEDMSNHGAMLKRLKRLIIPVTYHFEEPMLVYALSQGHSLQSLCLRGGAISAIQMAVISLHCHMLEDLTMNCTAQPGLDAAVTAIVQANSQLRALRMEGSGSVVTNMLLYALARHCSHLKILSAPKGAEGVSNDAVIAHAQGCCNLKTLETIGGSRLTDAAIEALAQFCPDMTWIKIISCHVNVEAFIKLLQRCSQLCMIECDLAVDPQQLQRQICDAGIATKCYHSFEDGQQIVTISR